MAAGRWAIVDVVQLEAILMLHWYKVELWLAGLGMG